MSGFTPGPWRVEIEAESEYDTDDPIVYVCHPGTVCDASTIAEMTWSGSQKQAERIANGHLTATGPDLLALAYQYRDDLRYPPTGDSIQRRIERAEAIIAKAEGRS